MLMTNENVHLFPHDRIMAHTILRLIPKWILPNHFTVIRFICIPIILIALYFENWSFTLGLFLFAACTDAIDGSLARTRRQITLWGTIADPVADKLLVGSVVVLFVAEAVNFYFAALIILIELMIVVGAFIRRKKSGYISANEYGKIKMFLQIVGVGLLLLAKVLGYELVVPFAIGTLTLAIAFAIVSFLTYGL